MLVNYLYTIAAYIKSIYLYVFPEYPPVGIIIVGLSVLLLFVYLFKSGPSQAFKIAMTVLLGLSFLLFVIHHMSKLLRLNQLFS